MGTLKKPKPGIHIINAHYVTPIFDESNPEKIFEEFLKTLSKNCEFIKIQDAAKRIKAHDFETQKPLIAFSFDDGFEECYHTIAPLLEKYNTNAAFFINPNFVECDNDYYHDFSKRSKTCGKRAMSWKQISELKDRGHIIGAHTMDHINLGQEQLTDSDLDYQIVTCKKILEEKLEYKCDMFAFPYGKSNHLTNKALLKSLQNYDYIFSATNFKKYFCWNGKVINRRHIEPFWPNNHVDYFLSFHKT